MRRHHRGTHILPPRSMVGQLTLTQHIGVRIPGGQPTLTKPGITIEARPLPWQRLNNSVTRLISSARERDDPNPFPSAHRGVRAPVGAPAGVNDRRRKCEAERAREGGHARASFASRVCLSFRCSKARCRHGAKCVAPAATPPAEPPAAFAPGCGSLRSSR